MPNYKNFKIKVPKNLPQKVKEAIAQEVIDEVIRRTQVDNVDKNGRSFPDYSKEYKESFDFQFKRGGGVNLTLSGEMLDSMEVVTDITDSTKEIVIGYDNADIDLQGKVEGNCRGSYGQPFGSSKKARNFLGIRPERLKKIIDKYSTDSGLLKAAALAALVIAAQDKDSGSKKKTDSIEDDDEL